MHTKYVHICIYVEKRIGERAKMKSNFRGGGGSKMTPKNRTLEGKNRTLGGEGGRKTAKIVGHHLCMFPNQDEAK